MKGGVTLFRGTGTAARRYVESDRSTADDYYLEGGTTLPELTVTDAAGEVVVARSLSPVEYAAWVDWADPITSASMGTPRLPGGGRQASPRFAEMVVNAPKSLSVAAALHPEVAETLDAAQRDAAAEIRRWLARHSVTRVGPRGAQEVVPVEGLHTVAVAHRTSRAGDPHRHIHFQIGTRVRAAGAWRALDTAALFRQQGAIRALGTAVIAAHPHLAAVLDAHGLTLDPVTGEVAELEPFNAILSKRAAQVEGNLAMFETEWEARHPGQDPGPVVRARLQAKAWDHQRPNKKPRTLGSEEGWRRELDEAGYTLHAPRVRRHAPVALDGLRVQQVASRALDRCAAESSTWTVHTITEHVTRILTEHGVQAAPAELRKLISTTTRLAIDGCFSVLPTGVVQPEHVAHLTSLRVVAAETDLRDLLRTRASASVQDAPDVDHLARARRLDADQQRAAAAVASSEPLVVVEGAAGAGKTTMLGVAIDAAAERGITTRLVTPTKKAADIAHHDLGVPTDSVAALVYAHGWRWNVDGVWTRLAPGDTDPDAGALYQGPAKEAALVRGERIVVDEAGMLDQDTALALLHVADDAGATLALVGDRAQLPAVGRGGILDMAAQIAPQVFDMATVHRFTNPDYADLTVRLRRCENPAGLFDQLHALGLIRTYESTEDAHEAIACTARTGDAITSATNEEARTLNEHIRDTRVLRGEVDDTRTTFGNDGLAIGAGDLIQTRQNDSEVGVANRQTWTVHHVTETGDLFAVEAKNGRKRQKAVRLPAEYVAEHAHLAYAVTAYGVQGATVTQSHTVLSDALDAAGVYVGMTRGGEINLLHVVAVDLDDACRQFTEALERDRADRGLAPAATAAHEALTGLVPHGPVVLVNTERARLREKIEHAEQEAARWEEALATLTQLAHQHEAEREQHQQVVTAADIRVGEVRASLLTPLVEQATIDGRTYLAARDRMWTKNRARAGRFRTRAANEATTYDSAVRTLRGRWNSVPHSEAAIAAWARAAAEREVETDSRVVGARQEAEQAYRKRQKLAHRHTRARTALTRRILGDTTSRTAATRAIRLRSQAMKARRDLSQIEALPLAEAARLVRERIKQTEAHRLAAEQQRRAAEARGAKPGTFPARPAEPRRSGPERNTVPSM